MSGVGLIPPRPRENATSGTVSQFMEFPTVSTPTAAQVPQNNYIGSKDQWLGEYLGVQSLQFNQPALGSEISIQVPVGTTWRIISFGAQLTTSSTVANRNVNFSVHSVSNTKLPLYKTPGGPNQAQSTSKNYMLVQAYPLSVDSNFDNVSRCHYFFPDNNTLVFGQELGTATGNIDTGDQWSALNAWTEVWYNRDRASG